MYKNFINFFKKDTHLGILFVLSVIFFGFYTFFGLNLYEQYNSPDEQANYFFIKQFSQNNTLTYNEPLNSNGFNLIKPRSTVVVGENIVPGGFLGIILFLGTFIKIFGLKILPFLIPFLSAIIPIFFYFIIKKVFDNKKIALISSILLFIHPAFFYYSIRHLFPNILLIDFLILGTFFLLHCEGGEKMISIKAKSFSFILAVFGGLSIGFAIAIRLNELIWIGLILLFLFVKYYKSIGIYNGAIIFLSIILGLSPVLYYNLITYGSFILTGYSVANNIISQSVAHTNIIFSLIKLIILPFGFDWHTILKMFFYYGAYIFVPYTIFIIFGLIYFLKDFKKYNQKVKNYFISLCILSFFLIISYGSWRFNDHPDLKAISLGTSYIRYWLPIFVFSIPFIALAINRLAEYTKKISNSFYIKLYHGLVIFILLTLFIFSFNLVLFKTDESVFAIQKNIIIGTIDATIVIKNTESNAIIITDYDDKFIFPKRKVMQPFRNDLVMNAIFPLLNTNPVYYFGLTLPPIDIEYLNTKKLFEKNLQIQEVFSLEHKTLYKFNQIYDK